MEWQYLINKKYLSDQLPFDCKTCYYEGIPISQFFDDYMNIMQTDDWNLEIILKEYLIYYITAPAFQFEAWFDFAFIEKNFYRMNLATMILLTLDMQFDAFGIWED